MRVKTVALLIGASGPACVMLSGADDLSTASGVRDAATETAPSADGVAPESSVDAGVPDTASCKNKPVLVLGDGWAPSVAAAQALLASQSFRVTTVADYSDAGGPSSDPSSFAAVLVLAGKNYPPMSNELEQTLLTAHDRGVGLVFEEWISWGVFKGAQFGLLKPLMLYVYETSATDLVTFHAAMPEHEMWAGLPATFTTKAPTAIGFGPQNPDVAGVSVVATEDATDAGQLGRPAVFVKDGPGRIAQSTLATNYASENALAADDNVKKLYLHMVEWVARCVE